jgi:hypothetical protein
MASDSGQREQILSALGRLLPYFGSPMDALIETINADDLFSRLLEAISARQ